MIKHTLYFSLLIFSLLFGCKNGNDPSDTPISAEASFVYLAPTEKELNDSTIYLPAYYLAVPVNSTASGYPGALFKNKTTLSHPSWDYKIQWKLTHFESDSLVKSDSSATFHFEPLLEGKYKLGLYIWDNKQSDPSNALLDSAFKTLIVTKNRTLKSIIIDTLSVTSSIYLPFIPKDAVVDVLMRIYKSANDRDAGIAPYYETQAVKGLKDGATNIEIPIDSGITIPVNASLDDKDDYLFQFCFLYNGNTYPRIDNHWGLTFVHYHTGFLNEDKSQLLDQRKMEFGGTIIRINAAFDMMGIAAE